MQKIVSAINARKNNISQTLKIQVNSFDRCTFFQCWFCRWQDEHWAFSHREVSLLWILIPCCSLCIRCHLFPITVSPTELQQTIPLSRNSCTRFSCNSHISVEQQYFTTQLPVTVVWYDRLELSFSSSMGSNSGKGSVKLNLNAAHKPYDYVCYGLTSTIVWLPLKASSMQGPNLFSASESRNFFVL